MAERCRVFFALWPDPETQCQLARLGKALHLEMGGRATRESSIHLTLAFLGDVNGEQLEGLHRIAADVVFQPFTMSIDRSGCFAQSKVAWLAPRTMPLPLLSLVEQLQGELKQSGFRLEERPYTPHITVVRDAKCKRIEASLGTVEWRVEAFVLVRSDLGKQPSPYSTIGHWPDRN